MKKTAFRLLLLAALLIAAAAPPSLAQCFFYCWPTVDGGVCCWTESCDMICS